MWQVEYEQCPRGHTWEFKFDHIPLDDGRWHPVNRDLRAVYRVDHDAIQYCAPGTEIPEEEWRVLLNDLKVAGPIPTHREVHLLLECGDGGYTVRPATPPNAPGVALAALTGPDLTAAYHKLRRRESTP